MRIVASKKLRFTNLTKLLLLCVSVLFIPLLFGESNFNVSADRFIALTLIYLLFLTFQQFHFSERQLILLLQFVLLGVWVEALFGWWQFIDGLIAERVSSGSQARPYGIFQQVNVMASFMAAGLVLSAYMLAKDSSCKKFNLVQLLYIGMPFVTVHLLHALASRTGWLGAIGGTLFVLPYVWKNANRKLLMIWLVMCAGGAAVSWGVVPQVGWKASEKEIISLQGVRNLTMPQTIDMILDKPMTGYGYGNFESSYIHYTAQRHAEDPGYPPGYPALSHPHNELIYWTVEGGIIALGALLFAAFLVWQRVYKNEIRTRLALVGLFFPILLHSQLEFPFYQSVGHLVVFVLLIYWVDNLTADYQEKELNSTTLFGVAGFVIPLVTTVYIVTTLHTGLLVTKFEFGRLESIEDLQKISNPVVWQDRLNWTIRSRLVVDGILSGQPELAQGYIDWIPELIAREPRPRFYQYLVIANQSLGNIDEVARVQEEAYYLFPNETFELSGISRLITRPITIIGAQEVDTN